MRRRLILAAGAGIGAIAVVLAIAVSGRDVSSWPMIGWERGKPAGPVEPHNHDHHHDDDDAAKENKITLSDAQTSAAGIDVAEVRGGILQHHFLVPGAIVPDANRVARVAVRLLGTVTELRKGIGDAVEQGEIVAVIESREVADAKSEYLATRLTSELQQTLAARLKTLWENRASPEIDYLRARLAAQDAQIRFDGARQKLFALGLSEAEISGLPDQPVESLRKQPLRSPMRGRVAERRVDLGGLVGREGQESELFVIVDLDQVWADLSVAPADVVKVRDNAQITVTSAATGAEAKAGIVFISPLLDKDTRNARVIASLPNPDHTWRPGTFITAEIPLGGEPAKVLIPKSAIQTLKGEPVVFVRQGEVFEARKVKLGREDDDQVEILSGLDAGETIAVTNTFTLKAELGKSEAEHEH
jgi:cobalt-zinc-cadmium efflux system membrane fusion protein